MSFKGTEHYRGKVDFTAEVDISGVRGSGVHKCYTYPQSYRDDIHALCDHIDEQDKKVEQLKTHLDTYAEIIVKRQQENAELQKEAAFWKAQAQKWEMRVRVPESPQYQELEQENAELRERVEELGSALRYIARTATQDVRSPLLGECIQQIEAQARTALRAAPLAKQEKAE